jgi:hypothetical protein
VTSGRQWQEETLALEAVILRDDFQLRSGGIDSQHVRKLLGMLKAGKTLPPVKVARIGKALYLVDGFHRYFAHEDYGVSGIAATVARMSLEEAREEAMIANTTHGKALGRADKRKVWDAFVEAGRHLESPEVPKSSRVISADLNGMYSHETVRARLRELGLELNEGPAFKPRSEGEDPGEDDDDSLEGAAVDPLAAERTEEAGRHLEAFGAMLHSLEEDDRRGLLAAARTLLEAWENEEGPARPVEPAVAHPF